MRSDVHKLFDIGYLAITSDHKTGAGKQIKEEFENGKEYGQFYGKAYCTYRQKIQVA